MLLFGFHLSWRRANLDFILSGWWLLDATCSRLHHLSCDCELPCSYDEVMKISDRALACCPRAATLHRGIEFAEEATQR